MTDDIDAIVRGLSEAQRRAVVALNGVTFTDWTKVYRQRRQRMLMHGLGIHEPETVGPVTMWCSIRLTPLGIAVRDRIMARWLTEDRRYSFPTPTHWQPLPAPPEPSSDT